MSQAQSMADLPELPDLSPGITLLETDGQVSGALPALVVDQLLQSGGTASWVDAGGHAQTQPLARIAPSQRVLDRITVARGFTAFQHYALVRELPAQIGDETTLVVVPALDARYRASDLRGDEGTEMLVRAIAVLAGIAREHDLPILVTRTAADEVAAPIATAATETIHCEQTPMGPRFSTGDFETAMYPVGRGLVQTTWAFWEDILRARARLHDATIVDPETPASVEVPVDGSY